MANGRWISEACNCDPGKDSARYFFQSVTGSGANDVWALSLSGAIVRRRNERWQPVASLQSARKILKLWVPQFGEGWAIADGALIRIHRTDELEVKSVGTSNSLHDIGGTPDSLNVWAVGVQNTILRLRPLSQN